MGWGTLPHHITPMLPPGGQLEVMESTGHFVHIEEGEQVASMVIEFLGGGR
jgi:pimeloyl-ACP methyl ester carboxylesterase